MELKQTQQQQLKMTPMLFEAISLLQYNQMDLIAYLKEKALENPLIEFREGEGRPIQVGHSVSTVSPTDVLEKTLSEAISFREDLKHQVRVHPFCECDHSLLFNLIDNLDEKGYFLEDTASWAFDLGYPLEEVKSGLALIRSLEPAGVGATSLQDCLLLQVERLDSPLQELITVLVRDYLSLLAEEAWDELEDSLNVSRDSLLDAYEIIKNLTPYPVRGMEKEPISYIIPDLTLEVVEGVGILKVDPSALPKLSVNQTYYNELLSLTEAKKDRTYVQKKYSEADWLIKGLARREETLLGISRALMHFHTRHLAEPPEKWQPLTLKEVADEIGVHESTVSRAIKGKYVKTPFGLLELKQFFPKGMRREGGQRYSAAQIKGMIREQIKHESPKKPLSDQAIAEWFEADKGLRLSRRVVAKYRMEMGIASSMKRRQSVK